MRSSSTRAAPGGKAGGPGEDTAALKQLESDARRAGPGVVGVASDGGASEVRSTGFAQLREHWNSQGKSENIFQSLESQGTDYSPVVRESQGI